MTMAAEDQTQDADRAQQLVTATRRVCRYLRFLGCERSVVEDLAQETMLAAVASFVHDVPPLPWLLTTARNCLRMHLRRRGRRREVADLERLHGRWIQQASDDGGDAQRAALTLCLQQLPERSRRVVELRYRDGLAREAIAAQLDLRLDGVKSLLARARAALGECIRRRLGDE